MDTIHRIRDLEINVKSEEMARLLGYGRSKVPERVMSLIGEVEGQLPQIVEPSCAYRLLRRHDLAHSPYLYHVDMVVLCLVTIGGKLEAAVESHKTEGDLGRALVLDTYGSAAAEAAADSANAAIEQELAGKSLYCSPRYSPGYACWDVKEQLWILPTLESEELGVTLTEGYMMVPRKSVSFAVTLGDSPVESKHDHSCGNCGMIDCLYKLPD
jgi:hypothetical protein